MIYLVSSSPFAASDVIHLPVFDIKYLKFDVSLSDFDVVIISSKNAISALLYNDIKDRDILIYCLSLASANFARSKGFSKIISANAKNADEFANFLNQNMGDVKALYLRGKVVSSDLKSMLKTRLDELVCYESMEINSQILPPKDGSIIIFASPLNFKYFYKKFGWRDSYLAISIGTSTSAALKNAGLSFVQSQTPSIDKCIKLARELIK